MAKYFVSLEEVVVYSAEIEADSPEQAKQKIQAILDRGEDDELDMLEVDSGGLKIKAD